MSGSSPNDTELEFNRKQWFYRRRLAFHAFWAAVAEVSAVTVAVAVSESAAARLNNFQGFMGTAIAALLSLTGAYMGFATWQDIKAPIAGSRPGLVPPTPFALPGQTPIAPQAPCPGPVPVPGAVTPVPGPRFPRRDAPVEPVARG